MARKGLSHLRSILSEMLAIGTCHIESLLPYVDVAQCTLGQVSADLMRASTEAVACRRELKKVEVSDLDKSSIVKTLRGDLSSMLVRKEQEELTTERSIILFLVTLTPLIGGTHD